MKVLDILNFKIDENQKTAFIAIVGRPNVGKSSLLNKILGQKITIVSNKPQTTRTRIMGVYTEDDTQLVFIDTPGMHKPKTQLGDYMVKSVNQSVNGVDACLLVVDANKELNQTEEILIEKFKNNDIPAILALNKIDLMKDKEELIKQITAFSNLYNFDAIVPICATDGSGVNSLIDELKKLADVGQHFFDEDTITDQSQRNIASEILREKILKLTQKEIPHGTAVVIEKFKPRENGNIYDIEAVIYCEKDTHKGILIGKKGQLLKKIGTYARQDMENMLECKVNLNIWVKVKDDWRNKLNVLRTLGYNENNFE